MTNLNDMTFQANFFIRVQLISFEKILKFVLFLVFLKIIYVNFQRCALDTWKFCKTVDKTGIKHD